MQRKLDAERPTGAPPRSRCAVSGLALAALAGDGAFTFTGLDPGKCFACAWVDQAAEVNALVQSANAPSQPLEQSCAALTIKSEGTEQVRVKQTSIADVTR